MNAFTIRWIRVLAFPALVGAGTVTGSKANEWVETTYLKASKTGTGGRFGQSVAISGDIMVVGAPGENGAGRGVNSDSSNTASSSGAAFVFTRRGEDWIQDAYLKASNTGSGDSFGRSVAIEGTMIVVGAPMEDSGSAGVNGNENGNDTVDAGAAYVFVRRNGVWEQQAYLKASNPGIGDHFGLAVALSGTTIVVGAEWEASAAVGVNGNANSNSAAKSGAAYVFTRVGETWTQEAYLKASNTNAYDLFGSAVAISGETLVVGAPAEASSSTEINRSAASNSAPGAGAAYVFARRDGIWTQEAYLKAFNTGSGDGFGSAVAIEGNTVLIGAPYEDSENRTTGMDNGAPASGAAYTFSRQDLTWTQHDYLKSSRVQINTYFGESVALSRGVLAVGGGGAGSGEADPFPTSGGFGSVVPGMITVFTYGSRWTQSGSLVVPDSEALDRYGAAVSVSGDTIIGGAPQERSSALGINGDRTNNNAFAAGAAYAFRASTTTLPAISNLAFLPHGLRLTLPPVFGKTVGIEYSPDLREGSWIELGNFYPGETGMTFIDPDLHRLQRPAGYYRAVERSTVPR